MAQSASQVRATVKYIKNNYTRIEIKFRKEENIAERMENHCKEYGYEDRSDLMRKALETQMAIDRGEYKLTKPRKKKEEK